jgi:hypothetical protein
MRLKDNEQVQVNSRADAESLVHIALAAGGEQIGPCEKEEGEILEDTPIKGALLTEWVVVMCWVDPTDARSYTTRLTSPNLPRHHEDGLLHQALFQFD